MASTEVAEELAQDVLVRMWVRRDALDPEQRITGYLYRSAKNQALSHLKHQVS